MKRLLLLIALVGLTACNQHNFNKDKCHDLFARATTHAESLVVGTTRVDRFAETCYLVIQQPDEVPDGDGGSP